MTFVKTVEVEINVDMDDFEDEVLIDELESRGYEVSDTATTPELDTIKSIINDLHVAVSTGKPTDNIIRHLFYVGIGRIA